MNQHAHRLVRRSRSAAIGVCTLLGFGSTALAQDSAGSARMIILDRNLTRIPGDIDQISPRTIQYTDGSSRSRSIDRPKVLAIFARKSHAPAPPSSLTVDAQGGIPGVLRLTDGQIVPGYLDVSTAAGESIAWRSRRIGTFTLKLDRVSSLVFSDSPRPSAASKRDTLLLTNDDRVDGFVESIGKEVCIEADAGKTNIPIERIAAARFANPPVASSLPLVFLSDGSVLSAADIVSTPTPKGAPSAQLKTATVQWSLAADSGTGVVDLSSIDAILFEPGLVVPLASLAMASAEGLDGRRWTPTPAVANPDSSPIGLAPITISGPVRIDWKLPPNAKTFGVTIELPPDARPWGNASVTLSAGRAGKFRDLGTRALATDKPSSDLTADITGEETLRIEVRGKSYADVQARVTLVQPVILLAPPAQSTAPAGKP